MFIDQVVDEVSMEKHLTGKLPRMTIFTLPNYNATMNTAFTAENVFSFDSYCPENTEDFKECFDKLMWGQSIIQYTNI